MENKLYPEIYGPHAMLSFPEHNSSSRGVMVHSHWTQKLPIEGMEHKIITTGLEAEYAKYTFAIRMPKTGTILYIVDRYKDDGFKDAIRHNPETVVIYRVEETGEIGCFKIPYCESFHQYFGFVYKPNKENLKLLYVGSYIEEGTVFVDSPAVSDHQMYMYGVNANVALMSDHAVAEDAVKIRRGFLKKLRFKILDRRSVSFGSSTFPLNLFGSLKSGDYKPWPEIGDKIREDGLLMALRSYDRTACAANMSIYDVCEPDYVFDNLVYVRESCNVEGSRFVQGVVKDIRVISNADSYRNLPEEILPQITKYERALKNYYLTLLDIEKEIIKKHRQTYHTKNPLFSGDFIQLLVEARAVASRHLEGQKNPLQLLYRKEPLDEFRVEFVIEYTVEPDIGFKLTDESGSKGVIGCIVEDEDMPVDDDGNVADIICDNISIWNRMVKGRLASHYFSGVIRDVSKQVRDILGVKRTTVEDLEDMDRVRVGKAYNHLMALYEILSPQQYEHFCKISYEDKLYHLESVVNEIARIYYPIGNDVDKIQAALKIEKKFKPTYGPVTFTGINGKKVRTKNKVRIAPIYYMLLEKIADEGSSVSFGKQQIMGVLAPVNRSEKFALPWRNTAPRTISETEWRLYAGYCGRRAIAEMMDRSNNPTTQRHMAWNILEADYPTYIKNVVDRDFISLGGHKPLQIMKHILMCAGVETIYIPEEFYEHE